MTIKAVRSPPPETIPVTDHQHYALVWDLADAMARKDGAPAQTCWLAIIDAFWAGELPALFCFTPLQSPDVEGRALSKLPPRAVLAAHLLELPGQSLGPHGEGVTDADFAVLRGWTLPHYEKHEPFRFYTTRDDRYAARDVRFGLAIRRTDFERWLAKRNPPASPPVLLPLSHLPPQEPDLADAADAKSPKRRMGPTPGTVRRYDVADRALFPEIKRLMAEGMTCTAAANKLAADGKIKGHGTPLSRAKRLAKLYRSGCSGSGTH